MTQKSAALRGKIHVSLRGGLGNRVLGLLSGLAVGELIGAQIFFYWEPDAENPATFSDLFEALEETDVHIALHYPDDTTWPRETHISGGQIEADAMTEQGFRIRAFGVFGSSLSTPAKFSEMLRRALQRLRPVAAIRELIDQIPRCAVGLHVRMTDHLPCRIITPRWAYLRAFDCVVRERPVEPVFVCSDTPAFVAQLALRYPKNVVHLGLTNPKVASSRSSLEGVKGALAELWILSSCRLIIASRASSFARVAHMLGDGKGFELSGIPNILRSRQELMAWRLYSFLTYNFQLGCWKLRPRAKRPAGFLVSGLMLLAANFFCSSFYQNISNPAERSRIKQRLLVQLRMLPSLI